MRDDIEKIREISKRRVPRIERFVTQDYKGRNFTYHTIDNVSNYKHAITRKYLYLLKLAYSMVFKQTKEIARIQYNYTALGETYKSCHATKNQLEGENKKLKKLIQLYETGKR